jgi:hypothetical protein
MDYIGLGVAGLAFATAVVQHFRVSAMPNKIKAEIKADATLAAATIIADSLVAAARLKAEARLARESLTKK